MSMTERWAVSEWATVQLANLRHELETGDRVGAVVRTQALLEYIRILEHHTNPIAHEMARDRANFYLTERP
jgi:hypothetical protein